MQISNALANGQKPTANSKKLTQYLILALALTLAACTSDDNLPKLDEEEQQTQAFEALLKSSLDGQVMGYAYVIMRNGETIAEKAGGLSRSNADGARNMAVDQPMHVASISKFITTLAALRLLERHGIPATTPIVGYLPSDWAKGPGIDGITFMELLSHRSGFNEYGTQNFNATYIDSLRHVIAIGATGLKSPRYSNIHHSMFRVILPILDDKLSGKASDINAIATGQPYENIVNREIFGPLGIAASLRGTDEVVYAYSSITDNTGGLGRFSNYSFVSGGYGWHISAQDMALLWQKAWYTESIISAQMREQMKQSRAGLFNTMDRASGTFYNKIGQWSYSFTTNKQIQCIAIHYPDGTDLILYFNSGHATGKNVLEIAVFSYEDSLLPG